MHEDETRGADSDFSRPLAGPRVPPPRGSQRRPRRGPWRGLFRFLLASIFGLFLFLLGLMAVAWFVSGPPLVVEQGAWIDLRFDAEFPEQKRTPQGWRTAFETPVLSAQELAEALSRAAVDPRIEGVLLRADGFAGGWAQANELRERLLDLRARGKRVVAWGASPASIDYFLATSAERIHIAPEGVLWVGGLQAQLVFLRDTLQKAGIAVEAVSVGEYKSAPETFTEDASSEASRQQIMDYLDDVYATLVDGIVAERALTPERVRGLIDRALFDAEQAVQEGLADEIGDLTSLLASIGEAQWLHPVEYRMAAGEEAHRGRVPEIALIHVTGTIVGGRSGSDGLAGELAGHETVVERLQRAADSDAVRAVVLRIDSPGGSALASDLILHQVRRVRERKPVVVSMGEMAASGGYYVAMEADEIWADPLTLTGSIGVFLLDPDLSGAYDKLGLRMESYRRGENAHLFDATRSLDPAQRELLQEQLDRFYERFVQKVAAGRQIDDETAERASRGRVWSGRRAKDMGLVDAIGGVDAAVRAAAGLGGIDAKVRPRIVTFQPEPSFVDSFLQGLFSEESSIRTHAIDRILEPGSAVAPLRVLGSFAVAADGTPQFLLPWRLRVR